MFDLMAVLFIWIISLFIHNYQFVEVKKIIQILFFDHCKRDCF